MKNPPHPGLTVKFDCLEPLELTVTEGAKILGVSRQALNNLVNCKSGISPEMSLRLSKAFGSSPETWLRMQLDYDLAKAAARGSHSCTTGSTNRTPECSERIRNQLMSLYANRENGVLLDRANSDNYYFL